MNTKNKMNNCWLVIVFNLILMSNIVLASSTKRSPVQKDLRNSNITNLYTGHGKVILTFDDGPHPRTTPYLLDILSKYKIKATFFMLGQNIKKYPKIVERVEQEGHIIANHTFSVRLARLEAILETEILNIYREFQFKIFDL